MGEQSARRETFSEETLREIIRRIEEVARPDSAILFGSAARGETGPHSDIDLLIVKGGSYGRSRLLGETYEALHGVGAAVDAILVAPEEVERYRHAHCLVIAPAPKEGREVYCARPQSS